MSVMHEAGRGKLVRNGRKLRVVVCGSRFWRDASAIRRELRQLPPGSVVLHGGCRGADAIAGQVARELGFEVEVYPAQWRRFGKRAGPIRNAFVLREEKPDLVLAFHEDLARSKGTKDMVERAVRAGIEVRVFSC